MGPLASSCGERIQVPRPVMVNGVSGRGLERAEGGIEENGAHLSRRAGRPAKHGVCRREECWRRLRWRDRSGSDPGN